MSKEFQAMKPKDIRSAANECASQHRGDASTMLCLAMRGNEKIYAHSAKLAKDDKATPTNPYPSYLVQYESILPWNGLIATGNQFPNCAEAHVWLELVGRGKDPLNYTLVSFNSQGIVASPCVNCAKWVKTAFGSVFQDTPAYAGRTRQRTNR